MPPTGDHAHTPGTYPDWESNQQPFGSQASTQSTESHQPGQKILHSWKTLLSKRSNHTDLNESGKYVPIWKQHFKKYIKFIKSPMTHKCHHSCQNTYIKKKYGKWTKCLKAYKSCRISFFGWGGLISLFFSFFIVVQVRLSPFPPTAPPTPRHPHLPPSILPLFGFVHVSFIHVPWWLFLSPQVFPPPPLVTVSVLFIPMFLVLFCLLLCFVD